MRVTFDQVDSTDEVCGLFNKIFENQEQMEAKIMQISKSQESTNNEICRVDKDISKVISAFTGSKKKGKSKMKPKGSVLNKTLIGLILISLIGVVCFSQIPIKDITFDTVRPEDTLVKLLRKKFSQVNSGYLFSRSGHALYVDNSRTASGDGMTWDGAKITIQEAVTIADDYDVILVAGGGYAETVTTVVGVEHVRLLGMADSKQDPMWTNATPADAATWHLRINGEGWTVSGFRFHHAAGSVAPSIVLDGGNLASSCLIVDNYFTSSGAAAASSGIEMRHSAYDHRIIGNEFFNLTDTGHEGEGGCIYTFGMTNWAVGLVIENNIFYHNEMDIVVCGSFMQIRGNTFSGMAQNDDQQTSNYIDLVHHLGPAHAYGDGDYISIGSNIVVDNYFCDHFSWEIIAANGYLFNDTDSIAGNFCKDGVMGRGGPSAVGRDVSDAQLVPGRTYSLVKADGIAGDDDLFLISGGAISIISLVGYITEDIGAACTMTIELDHADQDFEFTDAVNITTGVDGGRIIFTNANVSTLTLLAIGGDTGSTNFMMPWFSPAGMIESDSTDADTTGTIRWYMTFIPLEPGVSVTVQ